MATKPAKRRQKQPDWGKIKVILDTLSQYPDGIWLRELARRSKIAPSTVKYYVDKILTDFVDSVGYKLDEDRYLGFRMIKLKPHLQGKRLDVEAIKKMQKIRKLLQSD